MEWLRKDNSSFLAKALFLFQLQFENRVQATLNESEFDFSKFLVAYGMETDCNPHSRNEWRPIAIPRLCDNINVSIGV